MLSAQCDELRAMAEGVGLAMPQAATLMMEAADTIWELRCKCADLMDEREEYVWTREFMDRMAKHCGTKDCPSLVAYVEGLEAGNTKLRELVKMMWLACKSEGIVGGIYAYPDRNSNTDERVRFEPLLHELGIEVER